MSINFAAIPGSRKQINENHVEKGAQCTSTTRIMPFPLLKSDFQNNFDVDEIGPKLTAGNSEGKYFVHCSLLFIFFFVCLFV